MNAFTVLMTCGKRKAEHLDDAGVIGVCYEAKLCGEGVDVDDPLYGICYYGIAVRHGFASPEALQAKRQREHEGHAVSDPKELGIRAIIARYGPRALVWRMVQSKTGSSKADTQDWANKWEKQAIAEAGGMLRDMHPEHFIVQTFNLTSGGTQNPCAWWAGVEQRAIKSWKDFQLGLEKYVADTGTSRVPLDFIDANGYNLGRRVCSVRQGNMIDGRTDAETRRAYLNGLPGWCWDLRDERWNTFQAALQRYISCYRTARVPQSYVDSDGYNLGRILNMVRTRGYYLKGKHDENQRRLYLEGLCDWTWNAYDSSWQEFQVAIHKYVRKTGSAYVPLSYIDADGFPLGMKVNMVRSGKYLKCKNDEARRREFLDRLPGWTWLSTAEMGKAHCSFERALLQVTTHPVAKRTDMKKLRNNQCVIRAHEIMRDRAVASVIDDVLDAVMARTS